MRIIPTLLALSLLSIPAPCLSAMPGQPCKKIEIGKTEKSDTERDIIACLATDQSSPAQIWKPMTSGGGVTGGCAYINFTGLDSVPNPNRQYAIIDNWGNGCKADGIYLEGYNCTNVNCFVAKREYTCGATSDGAVSMYSLSLESTRILKNLFLSKVDDGMVVDESVPALHRVLCSKMSF